MYSPSKLADGLQVMKLLVPIQSVLNYSRHNIKTNREMVGKDRVLDAALLLFVKNKTY